MRSSWFSMNGNYSPSVLHFEKDCSALLSGIPPDQIKEGVDELIMYKQEWVHYTKEIANRIF